MYPSAWKGDSANFALVAQVSEPTRSRLMAGYDEGWLLYRTRPDALWFMDQTATALRWGI